MSLKSDVQDVVLEAQAEVAEFLREFAMELVEEDAEIALRMMWNKMPNEAKEALKAERPQEYKEIVRRLNGGKNGGYS